MSKKHRGVFYAPVALLLLVASASSAETSDTKPAAAGNPGDAAPQRSTANSPSVQLEEVIISATKRGDQDLQSTPVTITAFSSEKLQNAGISNLNDLASLTAGLDIQKVAPGQSQVIMRGVTLGSVISGQPQNRATTGLYVNDVSFEQNGMNPDPDLFDLERVEVVKGPQGTLFGSSAMAGAIRYVTKRPTFNTFSSRIAGEVANTEHGHASYNGKGVVNLPLIDDTLAMRIMAYRNYNGGWIDNAVTGKNDINFDRETGARVSTLWQPADAFSAHLMLQYQKMNVGHRPTAQTGDSRIFGPGPPRVDDFTTYTTGEDAWQDKFLLSTLELNWTLGDSTLTSVTGLVDRKFRYSRPGDLQEFIFRFYGISLPNPTFIDPYTSHKFSQELRIATQLGSVAGLTAGAYFSDGDITYSSLMREDGWDQYMSDHPEDFFFSDPAAQGCLPETPDAIFCGTQRNDERQVALYGEFDFHVTDRLTLTAGARWFKYNQTYDERYGGYFNSGPTAKIQKFRESGTNPKFGVAFNVNEDMLLFASAAKGFRMGGVDDPIPSICDAELAELGLSNYDGIYRSDSLWTYEIGAKNTLFDKRVTVNGSVFDTEWSDIQTRTQLLCGYPVTQNATKQRIRGFEIGTRFAVATGFSVELNGNYTDARLVGDAPPIRGVDGDRAPFTPRVTFNGTLDYERPVANALSGYALLSFNHRGSYRTDYPVSDSYELPAQLVANIRLGVKTDRYKVGLFVRNLTDEVIRSDVSEGRGRELDWLTGQPRTMGIEMQADF